MSTAGCSWVRLLTVALVVGAFLGFARTNAERDSATHRSFQRGVAALSGARVSDPSVVWTLRRLLAVVPDPSLQALVERAGDELRLHATARLINPAAPPVNIPAELPHGIKRFALAVQAPIGQPRDRAAELVRELLVSEASGYVLTHQLLVAVWSEEQQLAITGIELRARRSEILAALAAEQATDRSFSDLFAERAALLLAFEAPSRDEATRWRDVIVAAQEVDGRWRDARPSRLDFDGQQVSAVHDWGHTTAWSVTALGLFLDRHG